MPAPSKYTTYTSVHILYQTVLYWVTLSAWQVTRGHSACSLLCNPVGCHGEDWPKGNAQPDDWEPHDGAVNQAVRWSTKVYREIPNLRGREGEGGEGERRRREGCREGVCENVLISYWSTSGRGTTSVCPSKQADSYTFGTLLQGPRENRSTVDAG